MRITYRTALWELDARRYQSIQKFGISVDFGISHDLLLQMSLSIVIILYFVNNNNKILLCCFIPKRMPPK